MKTYVVENLTEYIELIEKIGSNNTEKWYRGQNKSEYRLCPSALRDVIAIEDSKGNKLDTPYMVDACSGPSNGLATLPVEEMVAEFSRKAGDCLEYDVHTAVEWECISQHYGIPTRVLDWTTNAINALFFAVDEYPAEEYQLDRSKNFVDSNDFGSGGGAVFVIDPIEINRVSVPIEGFKDNPAILDVVKNGNLIEKALEDLELPICFSGLDQEKRISRQSGKFTTTGALEWPMDHYEEMQDKITKIFIPYMAYDSIRNQLKSLGITHKTMYVEIDEKEKIAKSIATETKNKFYQEYLVK